VEISAGYISSIRQVVRDTLAPGESNEPPLEEVCFVFHDIIWTYTKTGAQHNDSWAGN